MDKIVKIYATPLELAEEFAMELIKLIDDSACKKEMFTVALSGGSTPEILYTILGEKYAKSVPWQFVHFFWGDERCVPPRNSESNYGMTRRTLLSKIQIPLLNIHRVHGENDPEKEALRYSEEISIFTRKRDRLPVFDLVLLGLGEDGHTASIFEGHTELIDSSKICDVAIHPVTLQKRITLTGTVINNADEVTFIVTGKKKQSVVENILKKNLESLNYPASYIVPVYGRLSLLLDEAAAGGLH